MSQTKIYKLLMLGDASVGKTTLTLRYVTRVPVETARTTVGVDFYTFKTRLPGDRKVKLQIWDFGGEERYRFLLPTYATGTDIIMLLYDTTRRKTFEHIPDWVEVIRQNVSDVPIILVGSKIDLVDLREVSREEGEELARKLKVYQFMELSSISGEYIKESLDDVAELLSKLADMEKKEEDSGKKGEQTEQAEAPPEGNGAGQEN